MRKIFLCVIILSLATIASADIITLKSGKKVYGTIVADNEVFIRIEAYEGIAIQEYLVDLIDTIEIGNHNPPPKEEPQEAESKTIEDLTPKVTVMKSSLPDSIYETPPVEEKVEEVVEPVVEEPIAEVVEEVVPVIEEVKEVVPEPEPEPEPVLAPKVKVIGSAFPEEDYSDIPKPEVKGEVQKFTNTSVDALGLNKYAGSADINKKEPEVEEVVVEEKKFPLIPALIGVLVLALIMVVVQRKRNQKFVQERTVDEDKPDDKKGDDQGDSDGDNKGGGDGPDNPGDKPPVVAPEKGAIPEKKADEKAKTTKPLEKIYFEEDEKTDPVITQYSQLIPRVFVYPFRARILPATIGGAIFFTIMNIAMYAPFYGVLVFFMFVCYTMACNVAIIQRAACTTEEKMFEWPTFEDWMDWIGKVFLLFMTWIICYGPAVLYVWKLSQKPDLIFYILIMVGSLISPMYFLTISLVGGFQSLNVIGIFKCIKDTFLTYFITLIILAFVAFLNALAYMSPIIHIPLWGNFIKWFLFVYFLMVNMRILGTFYYANRMQLRWFEETE